MQNRTVRCWGSNREGQLGDDSQTDRLQPVVVPNLQRIESIAAGHQSTCALDLAGAVHCWGANALGELALGHQNPQLTPAQTSLEEVTAISLGRSTGYVLKNSRLYAWGDNRAGQFGHRQSSYSSYAVMLAEVPQGTGLNAGRAHVCAWNNTGTVSCAGFNGQGQLGRGQSSAFETLSAVTLPNAAGATAGDYHTCSWTAGGTVFCWGQNNFGQLALDGESESLTPRQVQGLESVGHVSAGALHNCARRNNGQLACWGANFQGQLGVGDTTQRRTPTSLNDLPSALSIASGADHTCGIFGDALVRCWGNNSAGQLGLGDRNRRVTPTAITGIQ